MAEQDVPCSEFPLIESSPLPVRQLSCSGKTAHVIY